MRFWRGALLRVNIPVAGASQYIRVLSLARFEDTLSVFEKSSALTHLRRNRHALLQRQRDRRAFGDVR